MIGKQAHAADRCFIRYRHECHGRVIQFLPGNQAWLAAGQPRHDSFEIAGNRCGLAEFSTRQQTGGMIRFDHDQRRRRLEARAHVYRYRSGNTSDTTLNEHVGRRPIVPLVRGFIRHHPIALHDLARLKATEAVPDILPLLKRSNPAVLCAACQTLAILGNKDTIPAVAWQSIVLPAMQQVGLTTRSLQAGIETAYCGMS